MKVYQLDPRHASLLQDHSSGYWWVRPVKRAGKYKGRVIFTTDIGESIRKAVLRKVSARRLYPWLMNFKTMGYVYGSYNFIRLLVCEDSSSENLDRAMGVRSEMISIERAQNRAEAIRKTIKAKFNREYLGTPQRKSLLPHIPKEQTMWVWAFKNRALNKEYNHIYSFKDYGSQIGKSRREFADYFGLKYNRLQELAAGRIKEYEGWTLIGEPEKITKREAIVRKLKQLDKT